MDSAAIATELESLYPVPSIHLETGLHEEIGPILGQIAGPLVPVFMPRLARDKLVESSVPWFQEARKQRFGVSLDELEQAKGSEQAWVAAQPGFEGLRSFLTIHKQDEGPFVLGSQVSYVDYMLVSMVEAFRRIEDDLYEKFVSHDERLRDVHQACRKWLEDDQ
jgi:glutathione S-transferase